MSFLDADLIHVLDEVLPARFGGGPTDYQLVEQETADGLPRVRLLVHPAVGPLDEAAISDTFLSSISSGSGPEHVMELGWRGAKVLTVERCPPLASPNGKILHLHQLRNEATAQA